MREVARPDGRARRLGTRRSPEVDDARDGLIELLEIDETQAIAILNLQLRRLAALQRQKIIDDLRKYLALALYGDEPLSVMPILLLGDPGVGKTHFAKQIADLLGHRSIDTTSIYAKVDLRTLAEVALPWPSKQEVTP